jgi:hypothetical protein
MMKRIRISTQSAAGIAVALMLDVGAGSTALGHDVGFVHGHLERSLSQDVWIGAGIALLSLFAIGVSAWLRRRQDLVAAKTLV